MSQVFDLWGHMRFISYEKPFYQRDICIFSKLLIMFSSSEDADSSFDDNRNFTRDGMGSSPVRGRTVDFITALLC